MPALFSLGRVVATPAVLEALLRAGDRPQCLLSRHLSGDWGELCAKDQSGNDQAIRGGSRILSAYCLGNGTKIWTITEADRSSTYILLRKSTDGPQNTLIDAVGVFLCRKAGPPLGMAGVRAVVAAVELPVVPSRLPNAQPAGSGVPEVDPVVRIGEPRTASRVDLVVAATLRVLVDVVLKATRGNVAYAMDDQAMVDIDGRIMLEARNVIIKNAQVHVGAEEILKHDDAIISESALLRGCRILRNPGGRSYS